MDAPLFPGPVDPAFFPSLVLLVLLACMVFTLRDPPQLGRRLREHLDQLGHELDRRVDRNRWRVRLPVFSAETIRGKEAEFIRERLPRKAPYARFVVLLFLIGVLAWWFARQFA
jgi:hypothetical protein